MAQRFETTRWSLVRAAARRDAPGSRQALESLCRAYWTPVFAFIRRQGFDDDEARDLTQGLFARLLERDDLRVMDPEKGKFRSFLLAAVRHYLSDELGKRRALKRCADRLSVPLDEGGAHSLLAAGDRETPETVFELQWARTVLERALARLRDEFAKSGRAERFERLKAYLTGDEIAPPHQQTARALGISEGAVRVAIHRLRARFGEVLRAEVSGTVDDDAKIDGEIRHLLSLFER